MEYLQGNGSIHFRYELDGETKLAGFLNHLYHVPDDFRPLWEWMAEDFWEHEKQAFDAEGPGWASLKRSTQWNRLYSGYPPSHPILVRTGALRASLTDGNADGAINEMYPTEMSVGTDLKTPDGRYTLGMLHQTGTRPHKRSPNGMVARPPVIIGPELRESWRSDITTWFQEEFEYRGD